MDLNNKKLKVVACSDIHSAWNEIAMPDADLLIIAGDELGYGDKKDFLEFNRWLGLIKCKYKHGILWTPGNHSTYVYENRDEAYELISNARLCIDEKVVIEDK